MNLLKLVGVIEYISLSEDVYTCGFIYMYTNHYGDKFIISLQDKYNIDIPYAT
jgi:hypothetical protein